MSSGDSQAGRGITCQTLCNLFSCDSGGSLVSLRVNKLGYSFTRGHHENAFSVSSNKTAQLRRAQIEEASYIFSLSPNRSLGRNHPAIK